MPRIEQLFWDEDETNVRHLAERDVRPEDVEEIVFGIPDEESPPPLMLRDGDYYVLYGQTGNGRLLLIVGEFRGTGIFRPFGSRDMENAEIRRYRARGK